MRSPTFAAGDDLGYHWYEAGKLTHRENTFNDFVDVVRGLLASGVSKPRPGNDLGR